MLLHFTFFMNTTKLIPNRNKSKFSEEEDERLFQIVREKGTGSWKEIAKHMSGKTIRQCRERYNNYLAPWISRDEWTQKEDDILISKYLIYGHNWKAISQFLVGRTCGNVKNRFQVITGRLKKESPYNDKKQVILPFDVIFPNPAELIDIFNFQLFDVT